LGLEIFLFFLTVDWGCKAFENFLFLTLVKVGEGLPIRFTTVGIIFEK